MARVSAGISSFELSPIESISCESNARPPPSLTGPRGSEYTRSAARQIQPIITGERGLIAGEICENSVSLVLAAGACGTRVARRIRAAKFFDDLHSRACAYTCSAGLNHFLQVLQRANAAGRLDSGSAADRLANQPNVLERSAAGAKPGGGLYEISAAFFRQQRPADLFFTAQKRGLQDYFAQRPGVMAHFHHASNVRFRQGFLARLQRADIYHHVNFLRPDLDGLRGFKGFDDRERGAKRKSNHGTHAHCAATKQLCGMRNVPRVYAHRGKTVLQRFLAEFLDVFTRSFRLQKRVIDQARDLRFS